MLKQRIITALILFPIALLGFFALNGAAFASFIGSVIVLAAWEWARLAGYQQQSVRIGYAAAVGLLLLCLYQVPALAKPVLLLGVAWWCWAVFLVVRYPSSAVFWAKPGIALLIGLPLLLPAWQGLQILKTWPQGQGNTLILMVMVLVWTADIGAYFAGRRFGVRKLALAVSPGKTWEGAIGGLAACLLLSFGVGLYQHWGWLHCLLAIPGIVLVVACSIIGDLTESMFKRSAGLKDSSQLLPGHGGILDRIDSLTAAVPVFAALLLLSSWGSW